MKHPNWADHRRGLTELWHAAHPTVAEICADWPALMECIEHKLTNRPRCEHLDSPQAVAVRLTSALRPARHAHSRLTETRRGLVSAARVVRHCTLFLAAMPAGCRPAASIHRNNLSLWQQSLCDRSQ